MNKTQRALTMVKSIFFIICAVIMLAYPEEGYRTVVLILDIMLLVQGFSQLVYYFTMTRHMVGGLSTLFKSIFLIDLGLFILTYKEAPKKLVMIYLIALCGFSAIVAVMNIMKGLKIKSPAWKGQCVRAVVAITVAIICICNIDSSATATVIFSIGMIIAAVSDIILCFKDTEMLYVG